MAYIGKEPIVGNFQKCDAITVVNGQAAYTLQVSSTNVVPESSHHMLVSFNGILQKNGGASPSFTVSGSTLTFASNLATGDVIDFVILLGNVLDLGVPSDDSVTAAKIVDNAISEEHLDPTIITGLPALGATPADTDELIVSDAGTLKRMDYSHIKGGGKVLQAVSATDTTERSHSSGTYSLASSSLTVDITPSATSSKILVMLSTSYKKNGGSMFLTIFRDSTNLGNGNYGFINGDAENVPYPGSIVVLDSPSSTSQLTYQIRTRSGGGDAVDFNEGGSTGSIVAMEIGA